MNIHTQLPELNENQWKLLYRLMLEVIGENEETPKRARGPEKKKYWGVIQFRRHYQNALRATQRTRLQALFNIREEV